MGICYRCMCSIKQHENGYCDECLSKMSTINGNFYEQGWVCPKCGAVMSPRQQYCINCFNNNAKFTCSVTTSPKSDSVTKGNYDI